MAVRKSGVTSKEVRVESRIDAYHQGLIDSGRAQVVIRVGPTVGRHEAADTAAEVADSAAAAEAADDESVAAD